MYVLERGVHAMSKAENFFTTKLEESGFVEIPTVSPYNSAGKLYQLSNKYGEGYYWIYEEKKLYAIKIHNFFYYNDYFLDVHSMEWPESLNITYFESVSGEEIVPYRRLSTDFVKIFFGGEQNYRAVIHKNIPIRSIGIEIFPEYYKEYLRKTYKNEYENPHEALLGIDQTVRFPELIAVLRQIWNYQGEGMSARLFYNGKIAEAVALIIAYHQKHPVKDVRSISLKDSEYLNAVAAYIGDHFQAELSLEHLANIACMGTTKLKSSFKQQYGCTISEYIRQRRLSHAEMLLVSTDFTMVQIAKTIGYSNPGRFAHDFKQSTGLLPAEYRKVARKK